jgi:hypothetical protein
MGDVVIENKLQPHPHGVDLGRWVDALEGRGTGHAALTKIFAKHGHGQGSTWKLGTVGEASLTHMLERVGCSCQRIWDRP